MIEQRQALRFRNGVHTPLGQITQTGLALNSGGVTDVPMRVLGAYAIAYVIGGEGQYHDANGLRCPIRPGDLILVFPEIPHTYGPVRGTRWNEIYYVFDGPVFDMWRAGGLLDPAEPVRHLEPIDYWTRRFEAILTASEQSGLTPPLVEICRLQLALSEALVTGRESNGDVAADETWLTAACALLDEDLEEPRDLHQLADRLGMSYDGFRKRFTRLAGMPPGRYRSTRLIDRACELMQLGRLTDRQIAERLGFCDEFYFSRRFKQVVGRSPRQFRQTLPRVLAS